MPTDWQLTPEERDDLSDEHRQRYDLAVRLKGKYEAHGPFGGWADGHNLLKTLGWTENVRKAGHRQYVSLVKPKTVHDVPCGASGERGGLCWLRMDGGPCKPCQEKRP